MTYQMAHHAGYGGDYRWPAHVTEGLSPEQLAVLEPPYHVRLQRPIIDDDGALLSDEVTKRSFCAIYI